MSDIVPIFVTHYGLSQGSILTLDEPGKTKPGNPSSVFDLAQEVGLEQIVILDAKVDGFVEAYKNCQKLKNKPTLIYGFTLTVCADRFEKSEASLLTEHKIVIFLKNKNGYHDALKIYNRAWTDNFYYTGRIDAAQLKELWTENLILALPYFSSFLGKNSLSVSRIVPDLPINCPIILKEIGSDLPFAPIIDRAIDRYINVEMRDCVESPILNCKTIYYSKKEDFRKYMVYRAILNRSSWDSPKIDHLSSDQFSFESYLELTKSPI